MPVIPEEEQTRRREALVDRLAAEEIDSPAVLAALRKVRRHAYVPEDQKPWAYQNRPLPIAENQTISQPLVVALMTHLLELDEESRVLEIGTGSGYQAAVLAELAGEVYSIEILPGLAETAAAALAAEGYDGIHLRVGDGYLGWPEAAPFDGIIVTCAPDHVPGPLQEQLAEGGRMVIPVGETGRTQQLVVVTKRDGELQRQEIVDVRFVPMTGAAEDSAAVR